MGDHDALGAAGGAGGVDDVGGGLRPGGTPHPRPLPRLRGRGERRGLSDTGAFHCGPCLRRAPTRLASGSPPSPVPGEGHLHASILALDRVVVVLPSPLVGEGSGEGGPDGRIGPTIRIHAAVLPSPACGGGAGGGGHQCRADPVQHHHLPPELRERPHQPLLCHQHGDRRVRQDVRQPLRRVAGIEGDVGTAGLEDAQHPHHRLQRALHAQPHPRLGADPHPAQDGGETVRPRAQPGVGQRLALEGDGDGVRRAPGRGVEERVQGVGGAEAVGGGAHQHRPLLRREQREGGDRRVGVRQQRLQEDGVVAGEAHGGVALPQVGRVLQPPAEPLPRLLQRQRQVELGRPRVPRLHPHLQAREAGALHGRVLEDEDGLEERVAGQVALQAQLLHHALQRHVLVLVGAQRGLAHAAQERAEPRVVRQVGAEREGVDEVADHPLHLHPRPPGDRRPHHHLVLARVAGEQRLEGGQRRHEERGPLAPGEGVQPLPRLLGEDEAVHVAAEARHGGARSVDRELQHGGSPRQPLRPPGELPLQHGAEHPLALPHREVRVLERGLRERRGLLAQQGGVERRHLAEHDPHAPPVRDHVVQRQEEEVLLRRHAEQAGAEERPALQLEGAALLLRGRAPRALLPRDRLDRQLQPLRGVHHLHRLAAARLEARAQRFVAPNDLLQGAAKRLRVERAREAHAHGDVVRRGPGGELLHEPEPLLREGERHRAGALDGAQRRLVRALRGGALDHGGQPGRRRRVEHRAHRDLHAEELPDARDHPRGQERVPAMLEERVVDAGPLHPQEVRPDLRQHLLRRRARRGEVAGVQGPRPRAPGARRGPPCRAR